MKQQADADPATATVAAHASVTARTTAATACLLSAWFPPDRRISILISQEQGTPVCFVLCDIGLPDIDGYEVARRLRGDARTAGIRLVAISGYGRPADLRHAREAGFDERLVKPVSGEALAASLSARSSGSAPEHGDAQGDGDA